MAGERFLQYAIIVLSGLFTLAALAWLVLLDHGPRWFLLAALVLIAALPGMIAYQFLRADLSAARGRAYQEWTAAGYRQVERLRTRETHAPDGTVIVEEARGPFNRERMWEWITEEAAPEPAPTWEPQPAKTTFVQTGQAPAPPIITLTAGQRARLLLQWCYDRAGKKLGYGQRDVQLPWTRSLYDEGMGLLQHVGLIQGRTKQGDRAQLVITPQGEQTWANALQYALAVFDTNVVDD